MKALSLTQSWASAISVGAKHYETRSWSTKSRGQIAIHAAKGFPKWAKEFAASQPLTRNTLVTAWPLGVIVCLAEIQDCVPTETVAQKLSVQELSWGDYTPGRFAWHLTNVRPLVHPIPVAGHLGLWYVEWDIEREIRKQLAL